MNNRPFLAVYTLMLWVCFGLMVVPGYLTYKRRSLNLDGKINQAWSQGLGAAGRLTIQNQLGCCGYFSPFIEATVSSTCYAHSALSGCKAAFLDFESKTLMRWYAVAFGLVPVHIGELFVLVRRAPASNVGLFPTQCVPVWVCMSTARRGGMGMPASRCQGRDGDGSERPSELSGCRSEVLDVIEAAFAAA
ncbi:hypothetical protein B0H14DRAFT_3867068 [Mycena olivaceomarginata]|nr:hypothetical protein B0H14DRAFT_3867068 [Mycena olivaceomarginata]